MDFVNFLNAIGLTRKKISLWQRIRLHRAKHKEAKEKGRPMTKADYEDLLKRLNRELDKHQEYSIQETRHIFKNALAEDPTLRQLRNDHAWIAACLTKEAK